MEAPDWVTHPELDILHVCSRGLPRTHSVLDCRETVPPALTPPHPTIPRAVEQLQLG